MAKYTAKYILSQLNCITLKPIVLVITGYLIMLLIT